jgi:hypothetical protein
MTFPEAREVGHAGSVAAEVIGLDIAGMHRVLADAPGKVVVTVQDG